MKGKLHKITLGGDDFSLRINFGTIEIVEGFIGKLYAFGDKINNKDVGLTEIVETYYNMQEGTAYNKAEIFDRICTDGLMTHIINVSNIFMPILVGNLNLEEVQSKKK